MNIKALIQINKQSIWLPGETFILTTGLFSIDDDGNVIERVEELPFERLIIDYVIRTPGQPDEPLNEDPIIITPDQVDINGVFSLAEPPNRSCEIHIVTVFRKGIPPGAGLNVIIPVQVNDNVINVIPKLALNPNYKKERVAELEAQKATATLDEVVKINQHIDAINKLIDVVQTRGGWEIRGYQGFRCDFEIETPKQEDWNDSLVLFQSNQPSDQIAPLTLWPDDWCGTDDCTPNGTPLNGWPPPGHTGNHISYGNTQIDDEIANLELEIQDLEAEEADLDENDEANAEQIAIIGSQIMQRRQLIHQLRRQRTFRVLHRDDFFWMFPCGNDRTYDVTFSAQRIGSDMPAATQSIRIISIDENNPVDSVSDLHYFWQLNNEGRLTIRFVDCNDHTKQTKGTRLTINWGDGNGDTIRLIDNFNNRIEDPSPGIFSRGVTHQYESTEPRLVTIIVYGAHETRQIAQFMVYGFAPIYTVRIDERRTYDNKELEIGTNLDDTGGIGLDYPEITGEPTRDWDKECLDENNEQPQVSTLYNNQARQPPITLITTTTDEDGIEHTSVSYNIDAIDNIYPFDSIDPILMDGLKITHYLKHDDWTQSDDGEEIEELLDRHNVMIEIPPFYYKIERGTIRQGNNPHIIDISICRNNPGLIPNPCVTDTEGQCEDNRWSSEPVEDPDDVWAAGLVQNPDDVWTSIHPEGTQHCVYLAAFLKNRDALDEIPGRKVSIRGTEEEPAQVQVLRNVPENWPLDIPDLDDDGEPIQTWREESDYEPIDFNIWKAIQTLFLMRFRTLDSTRLFRGLNHNDILENNNQQVSLASGMNIFSPTTTITVGEDTTVQLPQPSNIRFLGLDNLWGFRPTLLAGIRYKDDHFYVDNELVKDNNGNAIVVRPNTHINRPVISGVVGNNQGGFLPVKYEGFAEERYKDVTKLNSGSSSEEHIFVGVPTYLYTDTGVDFRDNGIFSIGNRTPNPQGDGFIEYYTERYMVKRDRLHQIETRPVVEGTSRQTPLHAIFVDMPNRELTITLTDNWAYRYIMWDIINGSSAPYRFDASQQTTFVRQYNIPQAITDQSPLDIFIYAADKLWNIEASYHRQIWVVGLDSLVNISPDLVTLDDFVVVNLTNLDGRTNPLYAGTPFAEKVKVYWGDWDAATDGGTEQEYIDKIPWSTLDEEWLFLHTYRDKWVDQRSEYSVTVIVDGGIYSNGGTFSKTIYMAGLTCLYTFPTVAGYCRQMVDGEILDDYPFVVEPNLEGSEALRLIFRSDHAVNLDELKKHELFKKKLLPIRWDSNGDLESPQLIDEWIAWDGPRHEPMEGVPINMQVRTNFDFDVSHAYDTPGVYYPQFRFMGVTAVLDAIMRIVALDVGESLPDTSKINWHRKKLPNGAEPTYANNPNEYQTLALDLERVDPYTPYARTIMVDWGDGTVIRFNPNYTQMFVGAIPTEVILIVNEEIDLTRQGYISAKITITTSFVVQQELEVESVPNQEFIDLTEELAELRQELEDEIAGNNDPDEIDRIQGEIDDIEQRLLDIDEFEDVPIPPECPVGDSGAYIYDEATNTCVNKQEGEYHFTHEGAEGFSNWIHSTFTNVRVIHFQSGLRFRADDFREVVFGSSIYLQNADSGTSNIDIEIEWFYETFDPDTNTTTRDFDVSETFTYQEPVEFKRHQIIVMQEGHSGIYSRDMIYPPQHRYRWNGIFDVTITAIGDYNLIDVKRFKFNSYPVYGAIIEDPAQPTMNIDQSTLHRFYDSRGMDEPADWDQVPFFKNMRMVMFNPNAAQGNSVSALKRLPGENTGVLAVVDPKNHYEALVPYTDRGDNIDIYRDVTGEYFVDALVTRTQKLKEQYLAEGETERNAIAKAQATISDKRNRENIAFEIVGGNAGFRGDLMVEFPNFYYNLYRSVAPNPETGEFFSRNSFTDVTNRWDMAAFANSFIVEVSDRKLETHVMVDGILRAMRWGATARHKDRIREKTYISAYRASHEEDFGGIRSMALASYWRESYSNVLEEARKNGYSLLMWNHVTMLQLMMILRFNSMSGGSLSGVTNNQWADLGAFNVITGNQSGFFPGQQTGAGTYKFAGILEPASGSGGSWLEGLEISNNGVKNWIRKGHEDNIEFLKPCEECCRDGSCAAGCSTHWLTTKDGHHGANTPLISNINVDPVTNRIWEWSVRHVHIGADGHTVESNMSRNSSHFLPKAHPISELVYNQPCDWEDLTPAERAAKENEFIVRKQWYLRQGVVGDNDWGFFATANILTQESVNHGPNIVTHFFKWGSSPIRSPNFFSMFATTNRGDVSETSTSIASEGDYTLLTYNDTPMIDQPVTNHRQFDFHSVNAKVEQELGIRISQAWVDENTPTRFRFFITIPIDPETGLLLDFFAEDERGSDTFVLVFKDDSTSQGTLRKRDVLIGRGFWYTVPGRYYTQIVVLDINGDKVEARTNTVELFGINVQLLSNRIDEAYRILEGQLERFFCQMSYGHKIVFDPGDYPDNWATQEIDENDIAISVSTSSVQTTIRRLVPGVRYKLTIAAVDDSDDSTVWAEDIEFVAGDATYNNTVVGEITIISNNNDRLILNWDIPTTVGNAQYDISAKHWNIQQLYLDQTSDDITGQWIFDHRYGFNRDENDIITDTLYDIDGNVVLHDDDVTKYRKVTARIEVFRFDDDTLHKNPDGSTYYVEDCAAGGVLECSRPKEIEIMIEQLRAGLQMQVAHRDFYDLVDGDQGFEIEKVDAIALNRPIFFTFLNSTTPPGRIRFFPEGFQAIDAGRPHIPVPGSFLEIANPNSRISWNYTTRGRRTPEVRVYSDMSNPSRFAQAFLDTATRGVDNDHSINIFVKDPVASIRPLGLIEVRNLPELTARLDELEQELADEIAGDNDPDEIIRIQGEIDAVQGRIDAGGEVVYWRGWITDDIIFDIAESMFYSAIEVTAHHIASDRSFAVDINDEATRATWSNIPSTLEGMWTITAKVWGWDTNPDPMDDPDRRIASVNIEIIPHTITLEVYDTDGNGDGQMVTGAVPTTVKFVLPNTTTNMVRMNYDTAGTGVLQAPMQNPMWILRENTAMPGDLVGLSNVIMGGPNFEHEVTFNQVPISGWYRPSASIVIRPDLPLSVPRLERELDSNIVMISVLPPTLQMIALSSGGFVPRTISITVRSEPGPLVFDFDATSDSWNYSPFVEGDSGALRFEFSEGTEDLFVELGDLEQELADEIAGANDPDEIERIQELIDAKTAQIESRRIATIIRDSSNNPILFVPPRAIDPSKQSVVYDTQAVNADGDRTLTFTYTEPGTYLIRVATNKNALPWDVQIFAGITISPINVVVNPGDNLFPGQIMTIDQNNANGEWIILIPGDWRTYEFIHPQLDTNGKLNIDYINEVRDLWNRGMMVVTLEITDQQIDMLDAAGKLYHPTDNPDGIQWELFDTTSGTKVVRDCVVYYKSNDTARINGRPWVFNIPFEGIGIWRYETWILPDRPEYHLWTEILELNISTNANFGLEEELMVN